MRLPWHRERYVETTVIDVCPPQEINVYTRCGETFDAQPEPLTLNLAVHLIDRQAPVWVRVRRMRGEGGYKVVTKCNVRTITHNLDPREVGEQIRLHSCCYGVEGTNHAGKHVSIPHTQIQFIEEA